MHAKRITKETTLDDLMADPEAYGAPSFSQYSLNPERYESMSQSLEVVDQSSKSLRHLLQKQTYEVFGVKCKTIERAESVAKDHGYNLRQMVPCPQVIPVGAGYCEINVVFTPKEGTQHVEQKFRD